MLLSCKGIKIVPRNYPPQHYTPTRTADRRQDGSIWHTDTETQQTKQHFSNLLLPDFCNLASVSMILFFCLLTKVAPSVVLCCCRSSASRFDVVCFQRCSSVYLGSNSWLFELLLPVASVTILLRPLELCECESKHYIFHAHWLNSVSTKTLRGCTGKLCK